MQYRNGTFTVANPAAAVSLQLGFVPDRINVYNLTVLEVNPPNSANVAQSWWINGMPDASANRIIYTAGAPAASYVTSNGFTPITNGGDWYNTQYTITGISKANPGVVTLSSLTPTNTQTLANGMIVTISGVNGMTQVNQNRYVVAAVGVDGATKFRLYDLFGNPVDTSGFGTYTSGGIVNQISYPATAPTISATTGQITAQGNPAGNQYDIGYDGITIGTSALGAAGEVMWWEAFYSTPTGW